MGDDDPTIRRDDAGEELFDGRYRVVRVLGRGGFGEVRLVEDTLQSDEQVALKLILPKHATTDEFERRFRNEIRVLRSLHHEGIPQIFNDGRTSAGEFYFTMAFVHGRDLGSVLREAGILEPLRVAKIVRQLVAVLEYAHERGVVHRDLKPGNVLLVDEGTEDERVRVLDFGIAKILDREGGVDNALTMETMGPIGTPHYMSPEQVRGQEVDGSTDYFALGVLIYHMVSGEYPYRGRTTPEMLTARLTDPPEPLPTGSVPVWIARLVDGLLDRDRTRRPHGDEVLAALEEGFENVVESQRSTRRALLLLTGAVLVLAGVLAILFPWEPDGSSEPRTPSAAPVVRFEPPLPTADRWEVRAEEFVFEGRVEPPDSIVRVNGTPVPVQDDGSFRHAVLLGPGVNEYVLRVGDRDLRSLDIVRVGGEPARVQFEPPLPASGELRVAEATWTLAGRVEPPDAELVLDDRALELDADGAFEVELELEAGRRALVVREGDEVVGRYALFRDTRAPVIEDLAVSGVEVPEVARSVFGGGVLFGADAGGVLTARVADPEGGTVASVTVDGVRVPLQEGAVAYDLAALEHGAHVLEVVATDAVGNASAPATIAVVADRVAPTFVVETAPAERVVTAEQLDLRFTVADSNLAAVDVDGEPIDPTSGGTYVARIDLPEYGARTVELRAVDAVGNERTERVAVERRAASLDVLEFTLDGAVPGVLFVATPDDASVDVAGHADHDLRRALADGVEIEVDGRRFSGTVPLPYGEHVIAIELESADGATARFTTPTMRLEPLAPLGCEAVEGSAIVAGRYAEIRHVASGTRLVLVDRAAARLATDDDATPFATPAYVGRHEVSVEQMRRYFQTNGGTPSSQLAAALGSEGDLPIVDLSAGEAAAFCQWFGSGGRLPTEAEWRWLVTNGGTTAYPWGDEPIGAFCNLRDADTGDVFEARAPIDAPELAGGAQSSFGIWNLVGNVGEWVRGTGHVGPMISHFASPASRAVPESMHVGTSERSQYVGFRVVLDAP